MPLRSQTTGRFLPTHNAQQTGSRIKFSEYSLTEPMTIPVSSSAISTLSYNPLIFTLTIDFTDGTVYEYSGVEPSTFIGLAQSSSVGRYFNYHIRDNYAYTEI
jgi:hypothetical protein